MKGQKNKKDTAVTLSALLLICTALSSKLSVVSVTMCALSKASRTVLQFFFIIIIIAYFSLILHLARCFNTNWTDADCTWMCCSECSNIRHLKARY